MVWTYLRGEDERDLAAVAGVLADDFVFEQALTTDGLVARVEGREMFCAHLGRFIDAADGWYVAWGFHDMVVYPGHDGHVFAEWRSRAVARSGAPYANRYAGVFRVRAGRIALLREYRDPRRVKEALAGGVGEPRPWPPG